MPVPLTIVISETRNNTYTFPIPGHRDDAASVQQTAPVMLLLSVFDQLASAWFLEISPGLGQVPQRSLKEEPFGLLMQDFCRTNVLPVTPLTASKALNG